MATRRRKPRRRTKAPARRRTTTSRPAPKRRRRARKVSGLDVQTPGLTVAGAIASYFGEKAIPADLTSKLPPEAIQGGKIALGILLPMLVKKASAKKLLTAVGTGIAVEGALQLVKEIQIAGLSMGNLGNLEEIEFDLGESLPVMSGDSLPVMSGDSLPVMSGVDEVQIWNAYEE